jgi:hypothetical protein
MNTLDFPGKQTDSRLCQFDFYITPVVTIDHKIYSIKQAQEKLGNGVDNRLTFFSEMSFQICFDQNTMFETNFQTLNTVKFTKIIDDLSEHDHTVELVLQGKNNNHSWFLGPEKQSTTLSVKIEFFIENLPTQTLFYNKGVYVAESLKENSASIIMGENGKQIMPFSCPIYPWLLANRQLINQDLGIKL